MSNTVLMNAEMRTDLGRSASRYSRNNGKIPGIVYGEKKETLSVIIEAKEYRKLLNQPGVFSRLIDLSIDGKSNIVLTKDIQFHPVSDNPLHIDFLRIGENSSVSVSIPVKFLNEELSPGLKSGGVLNVVRYELELVCKADKIPSIIEIKLNDLNIGDSIHISAVDLPDGVKPSITDRDFTIATIAAPAAKETDIKTTEEEVSDKEPSDESEDNAEDNN